MEKEKKGKEKEGKEWQGNGKGGNVELHPLLLSNLTTGLEFNH